MGIYKQEEDYLKCRNHPSKHKPVGVCHLCLRDRLMRLCPDCANLRPCSCSPTPTTTSTSSSSSFSSATNSFSFSSPRSTSSRLGATGRMSNLIDNEPAFHRSRSSAAFQFLKPLLPPTTTTRSSSSIWSVFKKGSKKDKEEEDKKMMRSKSVGVSLEAHHSTGPRVLKGRTWYFPSPIKVFRQKTNTKTTSSSSSRILQERSPLCRG